LQGSDEIISQAAPQDRVVFSHSGSEDPDMERRGDRSPRRRMNVVAVERVSR
jgi:hypothetical protein